MQSTIFRVTPGSEPERRKLIDILETFWTLMMAIEKLGEECLRVDVEVTREKVFNEVRQVVELERDLK
jgi:biotin synthase-related radical SAM superfamily protein